MFSARNGSSIAANRSLKMAVDVIEVYKAHRRAEG